MKTPHKNTQINLFNPLLRIFFFHFPTYTLSTAESEYVAASNAIKELIWLQRLTGEITGNQFEATKLYVDNQSAINLVKNPILHQRSKHIDIRYHFVREKFKEATFSLQYIETNDQVADIFTKAIPKVRFQYLRAQLGIQSLDQIHD